MTGTLTISPLLDQLQYIILPGKLPPGSPYVSLHNQAYEYFKTFWRRVFADNGLSEPVQFEHDFYRMDFVTLLMHQQSIAGLHLYSFFNLELSAHCEHEYFQGNRGDVYLTNLKGHGAKSVLTMEYFTVDPNWRKKQIGLSLGPILGSLGTRIQLSCGADASLTRAREDVGSDRMFEELGGEALCKNVSMYNTPVSIMAAYSENVKGLTDFTSRRYVDKFWSERVDVSQMTDIHKASKSKQVA
jgi:hypothetical protein